MKLRMKNVYTLRGAMIASRFFPALKKAAEGHFEGLEVDLKADGEILFLHSGLGYQVDAKGEEGKALTAWFQGWLAGFFSEGAGMAGYRPESNTLEDSKDTRPEGR